MTQRNWQLGFAGACIMMLSGCDGGAFAKHSNYDLQQAWQECKRGGLSAAGAQRCKNVQSECEKRLKDTNFRC